MAESGKEPTIGKESRPTAIDYDAPISEWRMRDLMAVVNSQLLQSLQQANLQPIPEQLKPELSKSEKENLKGEGFKVEKELIKPEKERLKPEKEFIKPEKEQLKPEKEFFKPEKELSKPEKEFDPGDLIDQIATRVVEMLEQRGHFK